MGRKSKAKRAGFRGTQFQAIVAARAALRDEPEVPTASGNSAGEVSEQSSVGQSTKKLGDAPSTWAVIDALETPNDGDFTPVSNADSPTYRLVVLVQLSQAISTFSVCRNCRSGLISIFEAERAKRLFFKLLIKCDNCSLSHPFYTSSLRPGVPGQSFDVNRRAALTVLGAWDRGKQSRLCTLGRRHEHASSTSLRQLGHPFERTV